MPNEALDNVSKRLDAQDQVLNRIEKALVGDPQMGNKGLVQRLNSVEKDVHAIDRKLIMWGSIATGAAMVLTETKRRFLG